jgi:hypothetical protein
MSEKAIRIATEKIEQAILLVRGQKIMLDHDLADLYGVSTKALKQAVRRNIARFPSDFMFELTHPNGEGHGTNPWPLPSKESLCLPR